MSGRRDIFDQAMRQGHSAAWDQLWDRALASYGAALQEFPDDPNALTSLGFALLQADRLEEALVHYQRAAALNTGDPVAPEKCGEIFERLGRLTEAAQTYLVVAEIHLTRRDVQKAIDNWGHVVRLTPDNLNAHSRLALACERTGRIPQAVHEYIEVARIFQRAKDTDKSMQAAARALQLDPQSLVAREAQDKLRRGVPLPVPERPPTATGAPKPFAAQDFGAQPAAAEPALTFGAAEASGQRASPLATAQEAALGRLAGLLFEEDTDTSKTSGSVGALTKGTGPLRGDPARRAQAIMHLGQAINSQSSNDLKDALNHYESAVKSGFDSPIVHFVLGALYLDLNRPADAIKRFKLAASHEDVGLGALFGLGQAHAREGRMREALTHLLEALKRLDQQLVPAAKQDALAEAYEGVAEGLLSASDQEAMNIVGSLTQFLSGEGWEERVRQARHQLDASVDDGQLTPLADLLATPGADRLVESLRRIETCMSRRAWPTAMEEAFLALTHSPTHLPLHIRMAEILTAENRVAAAIAKYSMVAETYRIRGEPIRAARIMQQALRLSPFDVPLRNRLIELLVAQRQTEEALSQFMDLADTYYQLADLESARNTYADALLQAQQPGVNRSWSVRLLHKMGDIDQQRLNWRDAQRVYEQLKALAPDDEGARATLIDLLFQQANARQAVMEVDDYLRQSLTPPGGSAAKAISFLEAVSRSHPEEMALVARLARLYQDTGRRQEAIQQYDRLGEMQIEAGQNAQAVETIRAILALGPAEPDMYQQLLEQLQS